MEFKTCKNCCMVFQYAGYGEELCPLCKKESAKGLGKVKNYLLKHPNADGEEILDATGVSEFALEMWLKEKEISIKGYTEPSLTCAMCGISIPRGMYCSDCNRKIESGAFQAASFIPKRKSDNQAMRFLRRK